MDSILRKVIMILASMVFIAGCTNSATTPPPIEPEDFSSPNGPLPTNVPEASAPHAENDEADSPARENTWMKNFGANQDDTVEDILLADDGGYYIAGATNVNFNGGMQGDIYLLRTDADGNILWEQVYEGEGYNSAQMIHPGGDDGLLISGVSSASGTGGMDIFLTLLDSDRSEVWSKTFGGPLDEFGGAWPMAGGGYILGGSIVDPNDIVVNDPGVAGYGGFVGRSNIFLDRIDADGNEIWTRTFGDGDNVMAFSGFQTSDGGFVILGTVMYYPENDDDILLMKIDNNGNEVWSLAWEEGNLDGYEVIQTSDGNYLVAGAYAPAGDLNNAPKDFLFIKVDPDGNEIWRSIIGDPNAFDWACAVVETLDGGYLAMGDVVKDLYAWDANIKLVKIDANGQLVWQNTINTGTHTMLSKILAHPDGGYVIAGSTYHAGNFDIIIIKTDSEGNVQGKN